MNLIASRVKFTKMACWVALTIGVTNLCLGSLRKELECHNRVVRDGLEVLALPGEVEALFGTANVDHFISNFGSDTAAPVWNSVTYFGGRYTLSLKVAVSIDYKQCKIVGAVGAAVIQINEVVKVEIGATGIAGATEKGQWRLNETEWKRLVKNKGDWAVVGVPILAHEPVKDFDEFVRQEREPRLNLKLGMNRWLEPKAKSAQPAEASR